MVVLLVLLAFGYLLLGPMTTATLASRWFFRRRGLALGLAAVATSAGGFVVVPLLNKAIELYGWRQALRGEAGILFVVLCALALLVLRDNPFKAGYAQHPENKGRTDENLFQERHRYNASGMMQSWRTILGNRGFWAPSLLLGSASGLSQALVTSAPAYGHQLGFTGTASALLISAFSIAAACTKILTGLMGDFWNKRVMLFTTAISMPLALGMLCLFTDYRAVLSSCALAGVALGGALPLSGGLIASRFGAASFGSVTGWTYVMISGCALGAVLYIGSIFDQSGSYRPGFVGLLLFSLAVTALALFLDLPVKPNRQEPFH
jgi:sugar phosphate permease